MSDSPSDCALLDDLPRLDEGALPVERLELAPVAGEDALVAREEAPLEFARQVSSFCSLAGPPANGRTELQKHSWCARMRERRATKHGERKHAKTAQVVEGVVNAISSDVSRGEIRIAIRKSSKRRSWHQISVVGMKSKDQPSKTG